jgi:type VI protein secretion system component VasF
MHNAFEYEWKGRDRKGRPVERRISIGPVLITALVGLVLTLTGHTLWTGMTEFVKAVKWW